MNKKITFALLMFFSASVAQAQESSPAGFYGFVTAGPTTFNYTTGVSIETNGYQLGLGYEFNESTAVEVSYGSLFNFGISNGSSSENSELTLGTFSGVFRIPGEKLTPYVKGGVASLNSSYQHSTYGTYKASASTWIYGAGVELNLDKRTAVRLEYVTTIKQTGYTDGNVVQIGIMSRF